MKRGVAIGPHEHGRIGIINLGLSTGALEAIQFVDVDPYLLADLPRRQIRAVVAEHTPRGKQHRRERMPDLLNGDALIEQPPDQLGALTAVLADQAVEQTGGFQINGAGHDTGGRRSAQGRAASIWVLSDSSVASSEGRPTSCTDIGRLLSSSAHGTAAAG